ncbi:hypothetical protein MFIFM68171_05687 [Madurella fahalii]|uniref:Uncharacterized protein n=1 Tax=Madurella fahalii TaxID=1157608 RepID=A0ABQ0GCK1_9PEZI
MTSFPELSASLRSNPQDITKFLCNTLHAKSWNDIIADPRLTSFVGMHGEDREVTRDVSSHNIACMALNDPPRINTSFVVNTPHCFIYGSYKTQTVTCRRINNFVKFLTLTVGVHRLKDLTVKRGEHETLAPKDRADKPAEKKDDLNKARKYALGLAKDKKANEALTEKIKRRIEADKIGWEFQQARERGVRLAAAARAEEQTKTKSDGSQAGSIEKGRCNSNKEQDEKPEEEQQFYRTKWHLLKKRVGGNEGWGAYKR